MSEDFEVLVDRRALLGECPLWSRERGVLYWVDILRSELHAFDPDTGSDRVTPLPAQAGAVALTTGRDLIAAGELAFALVDPHTGAWRELAPVELGDRMNDGACDPRGRFLAGTLTHARTPGASALYRLEHRHAVRVVEDLTLSNGIDWSPDGTTMYLVDTPDRIVWAFSYDLDTGELANKRPWAHMRESDGNPDGIAVDVDGGVWIAMHWSGRIRRHRPDGSLDKSVPAPTRRVTSLAFGGTDLTDLYVTSACSAYDEQQLINDQHAGALFRFRAGIGGVAPTPWQPPMP